MSSAQAIRKSTRPSRATRRYSPYGSRTAPTTIPTTPPRPTVQFQVYDFPYLPKESLEAQEDVQIEMALIKREIEEAPVESAPSQLLPVKEEIEIALIVPAPPPAIKEEIADEETVPSPPIEIKEEIVEEDVSYAPSPFAPIKTEPTPSPLQESVQEFLSRIYSEIQMVDDQHKQKMMKLSQRHGINFGSIFHP